MRDPKYSSCWSGLGRIMSNESGVHSRVAGSPRGSVDLYPRYGPTSEWDTRLPNASWRKAGGKMLDWRMRPLRYNRKESLINPAFLVIGDPDRDWKPLAGRAGGQLGPTVSALRGIRSNRNHPATRSGSTGTALSEDFDGPRTCAAWRSAWVSACRSATSGPSTTLTIPAGKRFRLRFGVWMTA